MHEILCAREKLRIRQLAKKFTLELAIIAYHFPVCKNYIHQHPLMPSYWFEKSLRGSYSQSHGKYGQTAGIQCMQCIDGNMLGKGLQIVMLACL